MWAGIMAPARVHSPSRRLQNRSNPTYLATFVRSFVVKNTLQVNLSLIDQVQLQSGHQVRKLNYCHNLTLNLNDVDNIFSKL